MSKKKLSTIGQLLKKIAVLSLAKFSTKAEHSALSDRVTQLEAAEGSFLLSVDFTTGMLVQTGSINGTMGVDYETGYLTFEPASDSDSE
ncbi:MAG: hypothetical protein K6F89_06330 [Prevotella sp.]|nr:hypothetical protein [Prevotella sp.]